MRVARTLGIRIVLHAARHPGFRAAHAGSFWVRSCLPAAFPHWLPSSPVPRLPPLSPAGLQQDGRGAGLVLRPLLLARPEAGPGGPTRRPCRLGLPALRTGLTALPWARGRCPHHAAAGQPASLCAPTSPPPVMPLPLLLPRTLGRGAPSLCAHARPSALAHFFPSQWPCPVCTSIAPDCTSMSSCGARRVASAAPIIAHHSSLLPVACAPPATLSLVPFLGAGRRHSVPQPELCLL